jgi:WD40 repeat protein/tRNA A-37 threonylcarbamoyl transferase component Bud32
MNNEDQQEPLPERLDRFENEFKAGKTPKLEDYVSSDSDILEVIEFIHIDLEQRFRKGQRPEVKDYIFKYPELQNHPNEILELLKREIYLLSENGERVGPEYHAITETVEYFDLEKGGNKGLEYYLKTYEPLAKELKMYFRKQGYSLPEINGFSVLEKIGQGGMGEVYKARQISLSRDVAIKIVRYDKIKDLNNAEEYRRRFQKEGQTLASINHVNVVKIYDAVKYEENLHLVMEYLEGESLQKRIQNEGNLSPQKAAEIVEKIARGLSEVHKKGVIHRDLKPDNIFLTLDGEPKVLDFGLARSIENADGRTQEWVFNGTPQYSSPEQSSKNGGEISFQTDVYGLGAILYSCLTGIAPFPKSGDFLEILSMVRHQEVVPILALRPNCPKDLEIICLKCLRKDPKQRYSSVLEFAEDLRRFKSGLPIMARPVGSIEKLSKWVARNPVVSAAISVAVITLISGTIISSLSALYAKEQAKRAKNSETIAILRTSEIEDKNKLLEISAREIIEKNRLLEISEKVAKENEHEANIQKSKAIHQKNKLEQQVYANKIQRAQIELDQGNDLSIYKIHMDSIPFPQREWEHRYLSTQYIFNHVRINENLLDFTSAKFSQDGKHMISIEHNGDITYWDAGTGQKSRQIQIPESFGTLFLSFRPDGKRILTSFSKNRVSVCDSETGKNIFLLTGHTDWIASACYSPDGKKIVTGSADSTGRIWDANTGLEIIRLQRPVDFDLNILHCVSFSPDGKWILGSSSNAKIFVWESQTGVIKKVISGHQHEVRFVTFSPDGKRLLSASADNTARVWDFDTGKELFILKGHKHEVDKAVFSPDGSLIATGGKDKNIKIWDGNKGQLLKTFIGHERNILSLDFSLDCKKLLSVGRDRIIKLWCLEPSEVVPHAIPLDAVDLSFDFTPDSKAVIVDSRNRLKKINLENKIETVFLNHHSHDIISICCSQSGKFVASASADKTIKIWDPKTGEMLESLSNHTDSVNFISFSPDEKKLISVSDDRTVKIWNTKNWHLIHSLNSHHDKVLSIAFSPDGNFFVTSDIKGAICVSNAESGETIKRWEEPLGGVGFVLFSKDGRYIFSTNEHNSINVWDSSSGILIGSFIGHTGIIFSIDLSPDGKRLVSGSFDGTVKVWSTESKNLILSLNGHIGQVRCVRFSKDGNKIASLGKDGFLVVWDANVPNELSSVNLNNNPLVNATFGDKNNIYCKDSLGFNYVCDLDFMDIEKSNFYPLADNKFTPDKKLQIEMQDYRVDLINNLLLQNRLSKDKLKLQSWAKPDSNWHKNQADISEKNNYWFAAAFHLKKLKEINPSIFKEDQRLENILSKLKE